MDVALLVYDLSGGLAKDMSAGLLGFQLDAIYHTSILLNGAEWVYDGNVVSIQPGTSHLGQPLQQLPLGKTQLPMEVIEEYIDSLRQVYTVEAYNLWGHNCNNFSNDLATFLVGKGIPDHIVNMPQAVLSSPMGRMLIPHLDQMVNARKQAQGGFLGIQRNGPQNGLASTTSGPHAQKGAVKLVQSLQELDCVMAAAQNSCAVVFFTSATCPPCKQLYPVYDQLAAEVGHKGTLVKVDVSQAIDAGSKYSISATPTFITFLRGEQENRWSGADPGALRGNIELLVQMAWPLHPHLSLNLPTFANPDAKPVLYSKVPPIPKLLTRMGSHAEDPAAQGLKTFIEGRSKDGPAETHLPDMHATTKFIRDSLGQLPPDIMFAVVDLLRSGLVDPRFSGYLAEEEQHKTIVSVLESVNGLAECPYALRLVTLQMACNLFSTPLYPDQILANSTLRTPITQLISTSFLDDGHKNVRVAAASLLFNVSLASSQKRRDGHGDLIPEGDQVELAASLLEATSQEEESAEALEGMLLALGHLVYCAPKDGELASLVKVMDAQGTVLGKQKKFKDLRLIDEVAKELIGKGL